MKPLPNLSYVIVRGGVPPLPKNPDDEGLVDLTELFSAVISPPGTLPNGKPHGVYCDIEVFEIDLASVTKAIKALGGTVVEIENPDPPLQSFCVDFGLISLPEAIEKLRTVFETELLPFETPSYWFRLSDDPAAEADMFIADARPNHRLLVVFQHETDDRPPLTEEQWETFCDTLRELRDDDGTHMFTAVEQREKCIALDLSEQRAQDFIVCMFAIAQQFPRV